MGLSLRVVGLGAVVTGLLVLPAVWAIDSAAGRDVLLVDAADASSVEVQRGLWELDESPRAGVPAIYGTPSRGIERVVFAGEDRILHPREDPTLILYLKRGDDHPIQAQMLWYFGVPTAIGGVLLGGVLLLLARRRSRSVTPA